MVEIEFWQKCWQDGTTAWNIGSHHPYTPAILKRLKQLNDTAINRVYVPGCGHGHDAAYFAKSGYQVIAGDVSPIAVEQATTLYGTNDTLTVRVEDIFSPLAHENNTFDMVFDRAVLCAFSPELRPSYVEVCSQKLRTGGLFVTIPFTEVCFPADSGRSGPPFAVDVHQVRQLLEGQFSLVYAEEFDKPSHEGVIVSEAVMIWRKKI